MRRRTEQEKEEEEVPILKIIDCNKVLILGSGHQDPFTSIIV